jgi:twitching motility protein PilT
MGAGRCDELRPWLQRVRTLGASDLHLAAGEPACVRVLGEIVRLDETAPGVERLRVWAGQLLEAGGRCDQMLSFEGLGRFRVHVTRHRGGPSIAVRHVPDEVPRLETLGLPPVVSDWVGLRQGLVLVTGPTGSGKSTTLAALIAAMNERRAAHIVTIEDPVEFVHRSQRCLIQQRQVGVDVPDFAGALRAVLRQDPDVVLIGELRDLETMEAALLVAETGHLVLATAHTRSAADTVHRFIGAFPAGRQAQVRTQLSGVLAGVSAQMLVRRRDGSGRVVVAETLIGTPAVRAVIRDDKVHQLPSLMQTGRAHGMEPLHIGLQRHYLRGVIRRDDALALAPDPDAFLRAVGESPGVGSGGQE